MTRRIEPWVPAEGRALLDQLLSAVGDPQRYRAAMVGLGRALAVRILADLSSTARVAVVCTAEDADFLARGFVEETSERLREGGQVALVCFWNDRQRLPGDLDIAPILRRYVEPIKAPLDALIVLESIIADGCTVKTNIQEVLATAHPARVIVAAPVILRGAADASVRISPPQSRPASSSSCSPKTTRGRRRAGLIPASAAKSTAFSDSARRPTPIATDPSSSMSDASCFTSD